MLKVTNIKQFQTYYPVKFPLYALVMLAQCITNNIMQCLVILSVHAVWSPRGYSFTSCSLGLKMMILQSISSYLRALY